MKLTTACVATAAALLLAACSTTPASRIADHRADYDRYPVEVQQKISAGKIDIGFTPAQVELALGRPTRKSNRTTDKGQAEVWGYSPSKPSFSFGVGGGSFGRGVGGGGSVSTTTGGSDNEEKLRVVFVNGVVSEIEQSLK